MNKRFIIIVACVIVAIGAMCGYFLLKPAKYCSDYFGELGLRFQMEYDEVKSVLGEPETVRESGKGTRWEYDGLSLYFFDGKLETFWVMSEEYRFGKKNIGIGDSKAVIEEIYKGIEAYTSNFPNELAYYDGETLVVYYFDNENKVDQIDIAINKK